MKMTTVLPVEIIELLLSSDILDVKDIINFSLTCSHFYIMIRNSNAIWKTVYSRRWPNFFNLFPPNSISSWYSEVKYIFEIDKKCCDILSDMPAKFYKRYQLSNGDMADWKNMMDDHPFASFYIIQKLMSIVNDKRKIAGINTVKINTPGSLTYRFYANKALRFVRQQQLTKEWETYTSLPPEEQILERGAVFLAQWCQPTVDISLNDIGNQLDEIANNVKDVLFRSNPDHPIFSMPKYVLDKWKKFNLVRNQYNAVACRQILDALAIVLFKELQFFGNRALYYVPETSYINEVLTKRQGVPITLGIVYESVARRLGVLCEPIHDSTDFFLRWTFGPSSEDFFYIDVFTGHFVTITSLPRLKDHAIRKNYYVCTAKKLITRLANDLEKSGRRHMTTNPNGHINRFRSYLELMQVINSNDLTCLLNLSKFYMLYNMDVTELTALLLNTQFDDSREVQAHQIVQMLQDHEAHHKNERTSEYPKVEIAPRVPELKFAVGMVMRHLRLGYTCVIYDWDRICLASADWQKQMNVSSLLYKDKQPFYNVLAEDGSHRYVAQENLKPITDPRSLLLNDDLGIHFSHFCGTHFVPHAEKEKEYPEDANVLRMFHEKLLLDVN